MLTFGTIGAIEAAIYPASRTWRDDVTSILMQGLAYGSTLSCPLDRLTLLAAGNDSKVGALFAQAELRRNFCGQRNILMAPTPKYRALWKAIAERQRGANSYSLRFIGLNERPTQGDAHGAPRDDGLPPTSWLASHSAHSVRVGASEAAALAGFSDRPSNRLVLI